MAGFAIAVGTTDLAEQPREKIEPRRGSTSGAYLLARDAARIPLPPGQGSPGRLHWAAVAGDSLAADAITVSVEVIGVRASDPNWSRNIAWPITAPATAIDVGTRRDARAVTGSAAAARGWLRTSTPASIPALIVGRRSDLAVIAPASSAGIGPAAGKGVGGPRVRGAAAELRPASVDRSAVDRNCPDGVKLRPAVLGVVDISADQDQPITDAGAGKVPVVTRHELNHQVPVLLGVVVRHQHASVLRVELHQDVDVAIFLVADVLDRARDPAAGIAHQ